MKRTLSTFFVLFASLMLFSNNVTAETTPFWPVEPWDDEEHYFVEMVVNTWPGENTFIRHIDFCTNNCHINCKAIQVEFTKQTRCTPKCMYHGEIDTQESKEELASLADEDNFSYWNWMYLVNYDVGVELSIYSLEVRVNSDGNEETEEENRRFLGDSSFPIARNIHYETTPWDILSGDSDSYIYLDMSSAQEAYIWSIASVDHSSIATPAQAMVHDLGKFGTGTLFPTGNPKFGEWDGGICSEVISWYYYEYGDWQSGFPYNLFKDIVSWADMYDIFDDEEYDRAYCWNKGTEQFERGESSTTDPEPGDAFFHDDSLPGGEQQDPNILGHAMMILSEWQGDYPDEHFYYMDGSYPIRVKRRFRSTISAEDGVGYCLGKIPENNPI